MAAPANKPSHADLLSEQAYIDSAYECLDAELERLRTHPIADSAGDRFAARSLKQEELKRLAELDAASDAICIGRMDPEDGSPIYLGRTRIVDDASRVKLVNWQAPAAAAFHRATPRSPEGLRAKRTFSMRDRQLLAIDERTFKAIEDEVAEPTEAVSDALLVELERSRAPEMRDIVATIQADQFEVIASELDGTIVVQGGPGTGKTAVGLHRASWLLFNFRERLERNGVLVVGPNRAFMDYIGQVLPGLGETAVDQVSIEMLAGVRPRYEDAMEVRRLKGDLRMAEVIRREARRRIAPPEESLKAQFDRRTYEIAPDAISGLVDSLVGLNLPYMEGRRRFRTGFTDLVLDAVASRRSLGLSADEMASLSSQIRNSREFQNAAERIWPTLSARQLVHELLTGPQRLETAADGLLSEAERTTLRRSDSPLQQARWTRSDVALIHEADIVVRGPWERYGHVIVDEAQDLTPMEVLMVGRRSIEGSMTMLGDLAQATGPWRWASWGEITAALPGTPAIRRSDLAFGYRVPREVLEFAAQLLAQIGAEVTAPESVRSSGTEPLVAAVPLDSLAERAVTAAASTPGDDQGTVGLIAPLAAHPDIISVAGAAGIELTDVARDGLGDGVSLLDPAAAKGLEFDHVVVVEPASIAREPGIGASLLFVALTRATKTLAIVHAEPLPPALRGEPEEQPSERRRGDLVLAGPSEGAEPLRAPGRVGLTEAVALAVMTATESNTRLLADALEASAAELRVSGSIEDAAAKLVAGLGEVKGLAQLLGDRTSD